MATYPEGTTVRVSWEYKNALTNGGLYDPDNPKLTIKNPLGEKTEEAYPGNIVRDGVGLYHYDFVATIPGEYHFRAWATGAGAASSKKFSITVEETI